MCYNAVIAATWKFGVIATNCVVKNCILIISKGAANSHIGNYIAVA